MNKLIIGNWKMNFTLEEAVKFCTFIVEQGLHNNLILATPAPYLAYLAEKFQPIQFSAQNVSQFDNFGAYTGEYSSVMLKSCGVNYTLLGHSERRTIFAEDDKIIVNKLHNCLQAGVIPIICIGESLESRQNKNYKTLILRQLSNLLSDIRTHAIEQIVIAYEPLWSIGTNLLLSDEQLIEIFAIIHSFIAQNQIARTVNLVYGGSVNLSNMSPLLSIEYVNGLLIGKSALDLEAFSQILKNIQCRLR